MTTFFLLGGFLMNLNKTYYFLTLIPIVQILYQIKIFNPKDPTKCLDAFKSNNFLGLIILLNILITKNL